MEIFDCVVIGGGYAGLSAGIYLARYNRNVIIVDKGAGRWDTAEFNENYLGFPKGIAARRLRRLGLQQALRFGAQYKKDEVKKITKEDEVFKVEGQDGVYLGKTIILATGVYDLFPHFPGWKGYVGRSLYWCLTCDGFKALNKKVVIVGADDETAATAMQFLNLTKQVVMVTNTLPGKETISRKRKSYLKRADITIYEGVIEKVSGKKGIMRTVKLNTGMEVPVDFMFNQQGNIPNNKLAMDLSVKLDQKGYIMTNDEQRTNLPFVYAAGDVTKPFSHQIITAAHEGSMAAEAANYDLYLPEQKAP